MKFGDSLGRIPTNFFAKMEMIRHDENFGGFAQYLNMMADRGSIRSEFLPCYLK
jgi:hypothetical protein